MLEFCPHYHELKPILGGRNTDVANPGNSCGDVMPLVIYKSPFASSSVALISSVGPSSPSIISARYFSETSHPSSSSSTKYSGKKEDYNKLCSIWPRW